MISSKAVEYKRELHPAYGMHIYIRFCDGALSITGKCPRGSGQVYEHLTSNLIPTKGFEVSDIIKIREIWERWHLNYMRAGTTKQEEFIRTWKSNHKYDYTKACLALQEVNLLYDNGYKYGTSWLKEKVPDEVIRYLFSLPAVDGNSWFDIDQKPINEAEFLNIIQVGATNQ